MTRLYRVTIRKELDGHIARRYRHFHSWWQAWRWSRSQRRLGYITRTERIR